MKEKSCPNISQHTPQPEGYNEWHAWAHEMGKTHKQIRCNGCHLLQIWIPKNPELPTYQLTQEQVDRLEYLVGDLYQAFGDSDHESLRGLNDLVQDIQLASNAEALHNAAMK